MFEQKTDKQKAEWLRDNLDDFWAERFPEATLNGKASDLLIDIEQQLQIEIAMKLASTRPVETKTEVVKELVLDPELLKRVQVLESKTSSAVSLPVAVNPLDAISPKLEKLSSDTQELNNQIYRVYVEFSDFKHMNLTARIKWLILGR